MAGRPRAVFGRGVVVAEKARGSRIPEVLEKHHRRILDDWMQEQLRAPTLRPDLIGEDELRRESSEFLERLRGVVGNGNLGDTQNEEWTPVRELLEDFSNASAQKGLEPTEVATFVFSLKRPLFNALRDGHGTEAAALFEDIWLATTIIDELGLFTNETYTSSRERIIERQRLEMMELSTPVVKLWDGILALPIIGVLDSERAQVVMESLLEKIVETESSVAIIDITGVQTVDTLVAQHLLKTVAAAQLMGAECIISGVRPQIAQTIVHLGIDLQGVLTKATIADALALALRRSGFTVAAKNN
jgi:rsbT co-antagonist protein RsbR